MRAGQMHARPVNDPASAGPGRVRLVTRHSLLVTLYSSLLPVLAATAGHDTPLNPDDPAYLRRQYVWFQTQDPPRQQQLRKLHEDFQALDDPDQARLVRVMQAYNAWLARLPPEGRERVLAAPTGKDRLEIVRQLREREWVDTLPRPYREEHAKLDDAGRRARVAEWRTQEADRREEWALALRHWADNPGKVPAVFAAEGRAQLDAFVTRLKENLSDGQRQALDEARVAADDGNYFWYAREVVRLADQHPILPGRVGPKDFASLPDAVKSYLVQNAPQHFRPKGIVGAGGEVKELRRAQGRWPEFALELHRYGQRHSLKLPAPLGDSRKEDMPTDVRDFLSKTLEPMLRRSPDGKAELKALEDAQGKWPDYPRLVMDLARKHKVAVPGWSLPGPPQMWDRFRGGKNRPK